MTKSNCRDLYRTVKKRGVFTSKRNLTDKPRNAKKIIFACCFMEENCLHHNSPSDKIYVTRKVISLPRNFILGKKSFNFEESKKYNNTKVILRTYKFYFKFVTLNFTFLITYKFSYINI